MMDILKIRTTCKYHEQTLNITQIFMGQTFWDFDHENDMFKTGLQEDEIRTGEENGLEKNAARCRKTNGKVRDFSP